MEFLRSIMVAATGLRAQSGRMRVIAENIANANSTAQTPGGDPYRRRVPTFQSTMDREVGAHTVRLGRVENDRSAFQTRFEPNHPAADARGYVKYPNVNTLVETTDMREAQRSYEANLNVIGSTRRMIQRTLDILRG
jgi:flagellar basal-body rod protein FlgC